jgi:hypothetical protein
MSDRIMKRQIKEDVSTLDIPREEWNEFLEACSRQHHGWLIQLVNTATTIHFRAPAVPST